MNRSKIAITATGWFWPSVWRRSLSSWASARSMHQGLKRYGRDQNGAAAIEFAGVFPIMVALFLGSIDAGRALWMARKLNTATQSVADILARETVIEDSLVDDLIDAAQLIIVPFNADSLGYDIGGIQFDPDDGDPAVVWRESNNMPQIAGMAERAEGLGAAGEGVILVTMRATYDPIFITVFTGPLEFQRMAILRGRQNAFVGFNES